MRLDAADRLRIGELLVTFECASLGWHGWVSRGRIVGLGFGPVCVVFALVPTIDNLPRDGYFTLTHWRTICNPRMEGWVARHRFSWLYAEAFKGDVAGCCSHSTPL